MFSDKTFSDFITHESNCKVMFNVQTTANEDLRRWVDMAKHDYALYIQENRIEFVKKTKKFILGPKRSRWQ